MRVIEIKRARISSGSFSLPLFTSSVPAGFPNPAEDEIEQALDLNALMIAHPAATFFVRVSGDSMKDAGIFSGDILVVDRSLEAANGKIVVAIIQGEFTVKRLVMRQNKIILAAENPAYAPIEITEESEFQVWGVVTYVIHRTA